MAQEVSITAQLLIKQYQAEHATITERLMVAQAQVITLQDENDKLRRELALRPTEQEGETDEDTDGVSA